jgi:hypothetical protein
LVSKGAALAEDEKAEWQVFVEGGTALCCAARAVRDDADGAAENMLALLSAGETLADNETEEYQKHVDAVHEKWSVPVHKRDKDFQMESMAKETVECPICMEHISRSAEFVESRLCFHVVCIRCYAGNMLAENQRCARCACIKCPQCRKCTASCAS